MRIVRRRVASIAFGLAVQRDVRHRDVLVRENRNAVPLGSDVKSVPDEIILLRGICKSHHSIKQHARH